jgi:hypothetical protein
LDTPYRSNIPVIEGVGAATIRYGKQEQRSNVEDMERNHFSAFLLISRMISDPNIINFLHIDGQFFFHEGSEIRISPQSRISRIATSDELVSLYTNNGEKVELPVITPLFEKFIDDFLEISRVKPSLRSSCFRDRPLKEMNPELRSFISNPI